MTQENIEHPHYQKVTSAPTLARFYGIGAALVGKSWVDSSRGLYDRYYCLTVLYVPLLLLGCYLIQNKDGSEYVLAKRPIPTPAKIWNIVLILVALVGGGGYSSYSYFNSPDYLAKQTYEEGKVAIENGNYADGLEKWTSVYNSNTSSQEKARASLVKLLSLNSLSAMKPIDAAFVLNTLDHIDALNKTTPKTATELFNQYVDSEPLAAKRIADSLIQYSSDAEDIHTLREKQYALMQNLDRQLVDSAQLSIEFAVLDEVFNECARCETVLSPHANALGTSEGARILGQIYAASGNSDEAYHLLNPYTQLRLQNFHALSEEYDAVADAEWEAMIDYLNSPRADQKFIADYEAAPSEDAQDQLLNDYYVNWLNKSNRYQDVRYRYNESTAIVPVALDLGMVMLNRAVSMESSEERQNQLNAAEETFLAVKGEAENSDDYQWYLGQVYYWLGKETEGKALFEALIDKYNRSPSVLNSMASVLRDLGARHQAELYALEAYENSADTEEKKEIARMLSLLADSLDDKISWTEKSDPKDPFVRADLLTLKARQAYDDDNESSALNNLNESINIYKSVPESSSQHNNIALVYLFKYRITSDESDYQAGLDHLDSAVKLTPSDSIVLYNSRSYHLEKAYRDVLSGEIDLEALDQGAERDLFGYLYESQVEKQGYIDQLLEHPSMQKALDYTSKSLLLAPKDTNLIQSSMSLYAFLRQEDEMSSLASRISGFDYDLDAAIEDIEEYRQGVNDNDVLEGVEKYQRSLANTKNALSTSKHSLESQIIEDYTLRSMLRVSDIDHEISWQALVSRAERNYRNLNSTSTRTTYENILALSLIERLEASIPAFSQHLRQTERVYDYDLILATGSINIAGVKAAILESEEYPKLTALYLEGLRKFPLFPSPIEWYLLDVTDHVGATEFKQAIKNRPVTRSYEVYTDKTTANREYAFLYNYISNLAHDDQKGIDAIVKQAEEKGVALPL